MRLLITLGREGSPELAGIVSAVIWEFALLRHPAYSLGCWCWTEIESRSLSLFIVCPWNRMFIPVWNIVSYLCLQAFLPSFFPSWYQSLLLCARLPPCPSVSVTSPAQVSAPVALYFSSSQKELSNLLPQRFQTREVQTAVFVHYILSD